MALCGLLAQFLYAKFQCPVHIFTCIIMIVVDSVCRTLFPYYNFSENLIVFPVSVIKMWQKLILYCGEMSIDFHLKKLRFQL